MKLDADNPLLTAFALGELDEPERAEIEAQLAQDEAARKLVDEIRASAVLVTQELKTERAPGLSEKQQAAIYARHSAPVAKISYWKPLAAAAMLLLTVGVVAFTMGRSERPLALRKTAGDAKISGNAFTQSPPPASKPSPVLAVPPNVQSRAEGGDHFETLNLNSPHPQNAEVTKPSAGLEDAIGWGGEGQGAGTGTFGNTNGPQGRKLANPKTPANIGVGYVLVKPDEVARTQASSGEKYKKIGGYDSKPASESALQNDQPGGRHSGRSDELTAASPAVKPPETPPEKDPAKPGLNYFIPSERDSSLKPAKPIAPAIPPPLGSTQQKPAPVVSTSEKNEREEKAELEKLKKEIEVLRDKVREEKEKKKDAGYNTVDSKYVPNVPNATVSTRAGNLSIGGVVQVHGYKLDEKNEFKKDSKELERSFYKNPILTPPAPAPAPGTEAYPAIAESGFKRVADEPLSTFSIDVDTASYANVRRFLNQGQLPPRDAVRIEEMLNYFPYNYGQPQGDDPFAIHVEVAQCPWNIAHRLARVGIKGREFPENKRPAGNYVFLVDVSGSMDEPKKRPLVQSGLNMLVDKLGENDRVGIVTYAGEAAVTLSSTPCSNKQSIKNAINGLRAAGSTNGGDGIQRAYKMAVENFMKGGINRVILCTDGDFNVGVTNPDELVNLIEAQARSGVFLSVLGFGMGNLKDATMQKLADKGNGNYAYIDSLDEVRKVLVDQMTATLATIAKDVKIQVEFNPAIAGAYRLIGYEKRTLAKQDFNNDKIDAGEVGAGHQVTALYEIVPAGALESEPGVDPLIYQKNPEARPAPGASGDLLTLKIRYKQHDGETSKLIKGAVADSGASYAKASKDFKFAAAVAAFGMLLRESPYRGNTSLDAVLELADEARGKDEGGYRREFLGLVEKARGAMKK